MTSIDSRIVTMKFDNSAFQSAAAATLGVLEKLKGSISGLTATKGISALSSAAAKTDLTPISTQVEGISARFLALGTIAVTTLSNITNRAVDAGLSLANSLTLAPIATGLSEYETNLNSIQTILANTAAAGTKLKDVTGALDELNRYSDLTIYNFSEMARNIGTFTAAGVDLETSVGSIKGIANLAALSGSNSQQAATAMYQLSQAISAGRVSLMDWNSVVNAGMGGAVFQRALAQTAVAMGKIDDSAVKLEGAMKNVTINGQSFRESISVTSGQVAWLDGEVLTKTLQQFTGDLSDAELAAQGFNKAQIAAIQEQAEMAFKAATKVKTLTQLIDVAKETAQSGWSETWRYIFGDFREARRTFSAASYRISGIIDSISDARNLVLKDWADMGGRDVLIKAISDTFKALDKVLTPIRHAFRSVFSPITGAGLFNVTQAIGNFTNSLKASKDTMNDIRTIFKAVFGVLKIGTDILGGIVRYVLDFFGIVAGGTGGVLDLVASFAELVNYVLEFINKGEFISKFFDGLIAGRDAILGPIVGFLSDILSVIAAIVRTGGDVFFSALGAAAEAIAPYLQDAAEYLEQIGDVIKTEVLKRLEAVEPVVKKIKDSIAQFFQSFEGGGDKIKSALTFDIGGAAAGGGGFLSGLLAQIQELLPSMDQVKSTFSDFLDLMVDVGKVIGGALLAPFVLIGQGAKASADSVSGFGDVFGNVFSVIGDLLGRVGSFVKNLLPNLTFADVITFINTVLVTGILAGFARLQLGLGKMAGAFGGFATELRGVLGEKGILGQLQNNLKSMQNNIRADTILKIAGAVALLAGSLFLLSKIAPADIAKGIGAIAAIMVALTVAVSKMLKGQRGGIAKQAAGMASFSLAMIAMAGAITILAGAVAIFGNMDVETLAKGVGTVAAIMALFTGMAIALGKSGAGLAGTAGMVAVAVAMGIMAGALIIFTKAIRKYAAIDIKTLASGTLKIAAVLAILGTAMSLMSGGIAGAIALGILALSLKVLVPELVRLSEIPWSTILSGAGKLALALAIIGAAAYFVGPPLLILGAAIGLLGVGFLAFGLGVAAFAAGLATLAVLGGTAAALLTAYIQAIISQIPLIAEGIGRAIAEISKQIVEHRKDIENAIVAIIAAMVNAFHRSKPKIRRAMDDLMELALAVIVDNIDNFVRAGVRLITNLLKGIADATPRLARQAWRTIKAFMDAMEEYIPRIARKGLEMILEILRGIREAIDQYAPLITFEALRIGLALVQGVVKGIANFAYLIKDKLVAIAKDAWAAAKGFLGIASPSKLFADTVGAPIVQGMAAGIDALAPKVNASAEKVGTGAANILSNALGKVSAKLEMDPELSPKITPVLDLTQMSSEASKIGTMFSDPVLGASSYSGAAQLSNETEAARARMAEESVGTTQTILKFEQTNNSPKSLSSIDIYRDTKSLLATAKEALK